MKKITDCDPKCSESETCFEGSCTPDALIDVGYNPHAITKRKITRRSVHLCSGDANDSQERVKENLSPNNNFLKKTDGRSQSKSGKAIESKLARLECAGQKNVIDSETSRSTKKKANNKKTNKKKGNKKKANKKKGNKKKANKKKETKRKQSRIMKNKNMRGNEKMQHKKKQGSKLRKENKSFSPRRKFSPAVKKIKRPLPKSKQLIANKEHQNIDMIKKTTSSINRQMLPGIAGPRRAPHNPILLPHVMGYAQRKRPIGQYNSMPRRYPALWHIPPKHQTPKSQPIIAVLPQTTHHRVPEDSEKTMAYSQKEIPTKSTAKFNYDVKTIPSKKKGKNRPSIPTKTDTEHKVTPQVPLNFKKFMKELKKYNDVTKNSLDAQELFNGIQQGKKWALQRLKEMRKTAKLLRKLNRSNFKGYLKPRAVVQIYKKGNPSATHKDINKFLFKYYKSDKKAMLLKKLQNTVNSPKISKEKIKNCGILESNHDKKDLKKFLKFYQKVTKNPIDIKMALAKHKAGKNLPMKTLKKMKQTCRKIFQVGQKGLRSPAEIVNAIKEKRPDASTEYIDRFLFNYYNRDKVFVNRLEKMIASTKR